MRLYTNSVLLLACLIVTATRLEAQTDKCGWLPNRNTYYLDDAARARNERFEALQRDRRFADADSIYTLPIVVHVIHTGTAVGSADNPTDVNILAMIDLLNKAFRKNGPQYGGADMRIQFQLALRSPECGATTGINRVNGSSVANYVSGGIASANNPGSAAETAVKSLSRWSNTDYINIWIVNKINGSTISPGGYAYFPDYTSALTDGIVLNASVVNGNNNTIVHEMGHVFSLYHTFADGGSETTCPADSSCSTQGDRVCDTEPMHLETSCSVTTNTCTGQPFVVVDVPHNYTILNNYMGYTNCSAMFTSQQKVRVRAALFTFRHGLISSGALTPATPIAPATACIPASVYGLSPYYGVERVDFNSLHIYSNSSEADGSNYVNRTCNQSTTVIKGQSYTLNVAGSFSNTHRIKAFIDYNNDGDFNDPGETILSALQSMATINVVIPLTGVKSNVPLRMRVIADNPLLPEPTSCELQGDSTYGAGQAEDYAVVIVKREIYSVKSGNWNDPSTWSCDCIPQDDDQVTIKAGHTVTITAAMGNLQCGKITIEPTGVFNVTSGTFKVVGTN